jgi:hypothetical protein
MVGLGSAATMILLIFIVSYLHVATERLDVIGRVVSILVWVFNLVGFWLVPLLIYAGAMRQAERHFKPSERDTRLASFTALFLYMVHFPLILLLMLMTGMSRWPWR